MTPVENRAAPSAVVPSEVRGSGGDRSSVLREGWRLYGQGMLDQALTWMLPEAARSPNDPEPAYLLGMIFKAQGQSKNAAKAFAAAKRAAANVGNRTRAEMLARLAQANLALLEPESAGTRGERR